VSIALFLSSLVVILEPYLTLVPLLRRHKSLIEYSFPQNSFGIKKGKVFCYLDVSISQTMRKFPLLNLVEPVFNFWATNASGDISYNFLFITIRHIHKHFISPTEEHSSKFISQRFALVFSSKASLSFSLPPPKCLTKDPISSIYSLVIWVTSAVSVPSVRIGSFGSPSAFSCPEDPPPSADFFPSSSSEDDEPSKVAPPRPRMCGLLQAKYPCLSKIRHLLLYPS
jgi:hypothetical protein